MYKGAIMSDTETKSEQTKPEHTTQPLAGMPKRQSKASLIVVTVLVIVGLSLGSGLAGAWLITDGGLRGGGSHVSQSSGTDGNTIITSEEQDIAAVAKKVSPSVVSILTQAQTRSYYGGTQLQQGAGTGIIISSNGYVMTNKHVIQGSDSVTVVTSDGITRDDVKVVGTDPLNDLAFLKISGVNDLKPAALGNSTSIRIGQSVVAIGNALGQYQGSVTSGIISGNGRSVVAGSESSRETETLSDLIQTDAAINPGNSGGPLVNIAGEVIGVNTAIASDANGLGFSIPIGAAKGMIKTVIETGKVERSYLGVNYLTITPDVATRYKLPVREGAYIRGSEGSSAVASNGPAEKAGVKDGDIITKVNETEVGAAGSISSLIGEYTPGTEVKLTVLRDGKTEVLTAKLQGYKG